jgi:hypothetical protein
MAPRSLLVGRCPRHVLATPPLTMTARGPAPTPVVQALAVEGEFTILDLIAASTNTLNSAITGSASNRVEVPLGYSRAAASERNCETSNVGDRPRPGIPAAVSHQASARIW